MVYSIRQILISTTISICCQVSYGQAPWYFDYPVQPVGEWTVYEAGDFGYYRTEYSGYHSGEDWNRLDGNDLGVPVYSIGDGTIFKVDDIGSSGWSLVIEHLAPTGYSIVIPQKSTPDYSYVGENVTKIYSVYMHINNLPKSTPGQSISRGEIVGYVMNPGGGSHLHFEIRHPDAQHSAGGSLLLPVSNWAPNGTTANNGHYLNMQTLVNSGAREPTDILDANSNQSGSASISQGVTVSPSTVTYGNNFTTSFTLTETEGAIVTFDTVVCAITTSAGAMVRDMEYRTNISISANGTYQYSSTQQWRPTDPTGNYKAVARGRIPSGNWFDFATTGSGANGVAFQVAHISLSVTPNYELDFGDVVTTQSKDSAITITNLASSTANLVVGPSVPSSPFAIINGASLNLSPGSGYAFLVRFTPSSNQSYNQEWSFTHNAGNFSSPWTITLKGNGVGLQWQNLGPASSDVYSVAINSSGHLFAGTASSRVYRSINDGSNWTQLTTGLTPSGVLCLAINAAGDVFAGTTGGGIFLSTDNGGSWTDAGAGPYYIRSLVIKPSNQYVFAGISGTVIRSTNNGSSWTYSGIALAGTDVFSLAINSSGHVFAGTLGDGVFKSTDNGISWDQFNTGLTNSSVWSLAINSSGVLFAGTNGGGVFRSTNGGIWSQVNNGLSDLTVLTMSVNTHGTVFVGTYSGIFFSTNNGDSWSQINSGLSNTFIRSMAINSDGRVFAGTAGDGVFRSVQSSNVLPVEITTFTARAVLSGVVLNWRTATEVNNYGFDVERCNIGEPTRQWRKIGFVIGAGTSSPPHEYSFNDNGLSLGRYAYRIKQIDRDGSFKYYGGAEVEIFAPSEFSLQQNYPNPFNPSTTFRFGVPARSQVRLSIFDVLGRLVADLVDEDVEAGYFQKEWHANVASGIYFYRFEAVAVDNPQMRFVETRKSLFVK